MLAWDWMVRSHLAVRLERWTDEFRDEILVQVEEIDSVCVHHPEVVRSAVICDVGSDRKIDFGFEVEPVGSVL